MCFLCVTVARPGVDSVRIAQITKIKTLEVQVYQFFCIFAVGRLCKSYKRKYNKCVLIKLIYILWFCIRFHRTIIQRQPSQTSAHCYLADFRLVPGMFREHHAVEAIQLLLSNIEYSSFINCRISAPNIGRELKRTPVTQSLAKH